jgi:aryl-alcohol dehydrogenase-like predicted oxidoreductase
VRTARIGGLDVSVVGLGCNNFGRALDEEATRRVVDAALDAGVTYFDTSDNYGEGRSELLLGRALGARRADVVIATKFGMPVPGEDHTGGARPEYVARAVERSLRQLDTDWIDLYQLHKPDPATPIEETLGALRDLVDAGKVRSVGCSNLDASLLGTALAAAAAGELPAFVSDQVEYSLLHRGPEHDGLEARCREAGVALLPFYPLANGLLTGKLRKGETPTGRLRMDRYQEYLSERNFAVVEELRDFAAGRGLTMVEVAIGWLLARPAVPAVTPGATRPEQVVANVAAAAWQPTPDDLAALDAITAGPASLG